MPSDSARPIVDCGLWRAFVDEYGTILLEDGVEFSIRKYCFGIFVTLVVAAENLIISFNRTRRIIPGT